MLPQAGHLFCCWMGSWSATRQGNAEGGELPHPVNPPDVAAQARERTRAWVFGRRRLAMAQGRGRAAAGLAARPRSLRHLPFALQRAPEGPGPFHGLRGQTDMAWASLRRGHRDRAGKLRVRRIRLRLFCPGNDDAARDQFEFAAITQDIFVDFQINPSGRRRDDAVIAEVTEQKPLVVMWRNEGQIGLQAVRGRISAGHAKHPHRPVGRQIRQLVEPGHPQRSKARIAGFKRRGGEPLSSRRLERLCDLDFRRRRRAGGRAGRDGEASYGKNGCYRNAVVQDQSPIPLTHDFTVTRAWFKHKPAIADRGIGPGGERWPVHL